MVARLFQPSAKSGLRWMILVKVSMRARAVALIHLLHAGLHQPVDLLVARAAPHLPDRVLGQDAHHLVRIGERPDERGASAGTPSSPSQAAPGAGAPRPRSRSRSGPARG